MSIKICISLFVTVFALVVVVLGQETTIKSPTVAAAHSLNGSGRIAEENEESESEEYVFIEDEFIADECSIESQLKVAFVLFRHGQFLPGRAVMEYYLYPSTFENVLEYPVLTANGKRHGIELGQQLRMRYDSVLSELYQPQETISRSIDSYLNKAALFFVLDGLYPLPNCSSIQFRKDINWQPVPFNVVPAKADDLAFNENCPTYIKMKNEIMNLPAVQQLLEPFKEILRYVDNMTEHRVRTLEDLATLNYLLESVELEDIPPWVPTIQKEIERLAHINFLVQMYNSSMVKLATGVMLKEIVDTMQILSRGGRTRKLYLISGSEYNMASILEGTRLVTTPHPPKINSVFFLEVHYVPHFKDYAVKIYYKEDLHSNATAIPIKGCEKRRHCWVRKFIKNIKAQILSYNDFQADCRTGSPDEDNLLLTAHGGATGLKTYTIWKV